MHGIISWSINNKTAFQFLFINIKNNDLILTFTLNKVIKVAQVKCMPRSAFCYSACFPTTTIIRSKQDILPSEGATPQNVAPNKDYSLNGHSIGPNRLPCVGLHKRTTQHWEKNPTKWPNRFNPKITQHFSECSLCLKKKVLFFTVWDWVLCGIKICLYSSTHER